MLFIENGRVQDEPGRNFKTGLREIAKVHKGSFRLTTNQHLCVSDIAPEDVPQIKRLLAEYKLDNLEYSGLRLASSACVAFPTCGSFPKLVSNPLYSLSSRSCHGRVRTRTPSPSPSKIYLTDKPLLFQYLPILIDKVESICEESGLRNDEIVMRMTGCPNGCARPYVAGRSLISLISSTAYCELQRSPL
jgi:sulfite reductase (NADPH) hemoprotein beta-component